MKIENGFSGIGDFNINSPKKNSNINNSNAFQKENLKASGEEKKDNVHHLIDLEDSYKKELSFTKLKYESTKNLSNILKDKLFNEKLNDDDISSYNQEIDNLKKIKWGGESVFSDSELEYFKINSKENDSDYQKLLLTKSQEVAQYQKQLENNISQINSKLVEIGVTSENFYAFHNLDDIDSVEKVKSFIKDLDNFAKSDINELHKNIDVSLITKLLL